MKLRSTMTDEPDPGPPTAAQPAAPQAKKSWFKKEAAEPSPRKVKKSNLSEAASSYVTDEKPSNKKTYAVAAGVTVLLIGIQLFTSGDAGLQAAVATAYVYGAGVMMLWVLWAAFMDNIQRLGVFIGIPVCWFALRGMQGSLPFMGYFIIFTVFAYLAYLVDYIVKEAKSQTFKVAALSYMISSATELYFLLADKDFIANLGNFPTLKKVIEPIVSAGGMLRTLLQ